MYCSFVVSSCEEEAEEKLDRDAGEAGVGGDVGDRYLPAYWPG
jgi:hypothetical protein